MFSVTAWCYCGVSNAFPVCVCVWVCVMLCYGRAFHSGCIPGLCAVVDKGESGHRRSVLSRFSDLATAGMNADFMQIWAETRDVTWRRYRTALFETRAPNASTAKRSRTSPRKSVQRNFVRVRLSLIRVVFRVKKKKKHKTKNAAKSSVFGRNDKKKLK